MQSPEITYGTNQEKRVLFPEAKTNFDVDPFNRLGKSRTQTNKVKTSHLGTHDVVTITEEIEDGARMDEVMQLYEFLKSGGVCAVKRDSGLGFAASFNGRALVDQDRNVLGVFTRAQSASQSNAWYNDPHSGLLTNELLVDTPRFPIGQQGLTQNGLLLQRTRKNELDTDLANWTPTTMTVATSFQISAPDDSSPKKLTSTASNATLVLVLGALGTTIDGAYSFYLKSNIGEIGDIFLGLRGSTSGFHETVQAVRPDGPEPHGWTRHLLKHEDGVDVDLVGNWQAEIRFANSGVEIWAVYPQLEVGTDVLDPSGIIVGNALTRLDETYLITNTGNVYAADEQGSAGLFFTPDFDLGDQEQGWLFTVGDTTSELVRMVISPGFTNVEFTYVSAAGTTIHSSSPTLVGKLVKGQPTHFGLVWDNKVTPSFRGYINGIEVVSGGAVASGRFAGSKISIGARNNGTFRCPGIYDQVFVRKDALSAFDMFQMANNPQLFFERRNNWDTMILNNNLVPDENIGNGRYRFTLQLEETL